MTLKQDIDSMETVGQKALINLIAERTNYLVYEVEDVLEGLRQIVTEVLAKDKAIKLDHLFTIKQKKTPPREGLIHPITREVYTSKGSVGISIKSTAFLKGVVNGTINLDDTNILEPDEKD